MKWPQLLGGLLFWRRRDPRPEQTDNRPRPEDGDQRSVPQDPHVDLRAGAAVDEVVL